MSGATPHRVEGMNDEDRRHHAEFCATVDRLTREGRGARATVGFGAITLDLLYVGDRAFHAVGGGLVPVLLPVETVKRGLWCALRNGEVNG